MIRHLFKPTDAAIFIYFRFFAGVFLSCELINSLTLGDFHEYTYPEFHFTYQFFDWVKPWPVWGMVFHYLLTILAGFSFAVGIRQRLSAIILFIGYTTLFLMEKAEYVNHFYLYCLIAFWLIFMPVKNGSKRAAPSWYYWLMLFHMAVVYFYAGLAKLDSEWLSFHSVQIFLNQRQWTLPGLDKILTFGGLFFDLLIVPLLLWKPTRMAAFITAIFFHLSNVYMFGLATFPWFSLMMTSLFLGVSWPRRFSWFDDFFPETDTETPVLSKRHFALASVLAIYCVIHLALPLRHHLYPGQVSWTEEGHMFSWRMKLRTKNGEAIFYVMNKKNNQVKIIFPQQFLTSKQYSEMIGKPDYLLQFAHYLKAKYPEASIHASSKVSVNGKPAREMIDRSKDLSQKPRQVAGYDWVLPGYEAQAYLTDLPR
jgi:vitamin K-dependent gamma-carboxylase